MNRLWLLTALLSSGCWSYDDRDWTDEVPTDTGEDMDADGDGFTVAQGDCADDEPNAYPGSHELETPHDGIDTDCDGVDACSDLNCDGWPDVVLTTAAGTGHRASAFFGGPDGPSPSASLLFDEGVAFAVHVEDLDLDGYPDVVIPSGASARTSIYWGPHYDVPTHLDAGFANSLCTEDLNGDGFTDLIVPSANTTDGEPDAALTSVFLYSNGYPSTPTATLVAPGAGYCVLADRDGDGFSDLTLTAALPWLDGTWHSGSDWALGNGLESTMPQPDAAAARPDAADLDGDGRDELVVPYVNSSAVDIFYGTDAPVRVTANRPESATLADLDGDGLRDLVLSSVPADWAAELTILHAGPDGHIGPASDKTLLPVEPTRVVAVADLDGDGFVDLIAASTAESGESTVFWGATEGFDVSRTTKVATSRANTVAIEDLDLDGLPDLVFAQYRSEDHPDQASFVYLATGPRSWAASPIELALVDSPAVVVASASAHPTTR